MVARVVRVFGEVIGALTGHGFNSNEVQTKLLTWPSLASSGVPHGTL